MSARHYVTVLFLSGLICLGVSGRPARGTTWETFGNAPVPPAHYDGWKGLLRVVDDSHRVYTRADILLCFRGDTEAVNASLKRFAGIESEIREVVLRPGPGMYETTDGKPVVHEWRLQVPDTYELHTAAQEKGTRVITTYPMMTVFVWDKGGIQLDALQIPEGVALLELENLRMRHLQGLQSGSKDVRAKAAQLLAEVDPLNGANVEPLAALLDDESHWVRSQAASALGQMGKVGEPALPTLRQGLRDKEERVRGACQRAIKIIENAPDDTAALDAHRSSLAQISRFRKLRPSAQTKPPERTSEEVNCHGQHDV